MQRLNPLKLKLRLKDAFQLNIKFYSLMTNIHIVGHNDRNFECFAFSVYIFALSTASLRNSIYNTNSHSHNHNDIEKMIAHAKRVEGQIEGQSIGKKLNWFVASSRNYHVVFKVSWLLMSCSWFS